MTKPWVMWAAVVAAVLALSACSAGEEPGPSASASTPRTGTTASGTQTPGEPPSATPDPTSTAADDAPAPQPETEPGASSPDFCGGAVDAWNGGDSVTLDLRQDPAGYVAALLQLDTQVQGLTPPAAIADAWGTFQSLSADRASTLSGLDASDAGAVVAGLAILHQEQQAGFAEIAPAIDAYLAGNC